MSSPPLANRSELCPAVSLAVSTLPPKDVPNGSAIFNIFRNVGGSFGIAILSPPVTRREQFHDLRIGESITAYSTATQARVQAASIIGQQGRPDLTLRAPARG